MRKMVVMSVIMLVIIAGVTNQAFSMGKKPPAKKYFVEKYPQSSQAAGRVARVDAGKLEIILSTEEYKSLALIVNSETEFLKNGRNITLSDIKKRDYVRVIYEIVYKDKNVAKSISIEPENIAESKKQYKK